MYLEKLWIMMAVLLSSPTASANGPRDITADNLDLSCSGAIHTRVIDLWEGSLKDHFAQQIRIDVNKQGNTYTLYTIQEELQPFVEMTRRCKDHQQISELVDVLAPSFNDLESLDGTPGEMAWVCHSGPICNNTNHLLGAESTIVSAQYLSLLGAVTTALIEVIPEERRSAAENRFSAETANTIARGLDRWLDSRYLRSTEVRAKMLPTDVTDGSSKYLFNDRDIWYINAIADLSELSRAKIVFSDKGAHALSSLKSKAPKISILINLFLDRITFTGDTPNERAEIDRGYWRKHADARYARYLGKDSPIECLASSLTKPTNKMVRIPPAAQYLDANVGWDFSHARRLVSVLDTLGRNTNNLTTVFNYTKGKIALDPARIKKALAQQLVEKIWNGDTGYPLFHNYWDGSNGWYRAGYDNGTGCRAGQPPYSLSRAFVTGGYSQWQEVNPTIGRLARRLYLLSQSKDAASVTFISKNYLPLAAPRYQAIPVSISNTGLFTFLSSLVTSGP